MSSNRLVRKTSRGRQAEKRAPPGRALDEPLDHVEIRGVNPVRLGTKIALDRMILPRYWTMSANQKAGSQSNGIKKTTTAIPRLVSDAKSSLGFGKDLRIEEDSSSFL